MSGFSPIRMYAAIVSVITLIGTSANAAPTQAYATYEIIADGMCCQGCAKKVAAQLYTAPGVINVKADVPSRRLTITAKPSPKLTLEKLWSAVEKAKGKPSRLTTSDAVYTLLRPEQTEGGAVAAANSYTIIVVGMSDMETAQKVAGQLKGIRGIESLSFDVNQNAILIKPVANVQLSPWILMAAVSQSGQSARTVSGPYGRLTIEPVTQQTARSVSLAR